MFCENHYSDLKLSYLCGYREGYIEAMSEHVNIHIYGQCGAPCPGTDTHQCLQYLAK